MLYFFGERRLHGFFSLGEFNIDCISIFQIYNLGSKSLRDKVGNEESSIQLGRMLSSTNRP